MLKRNQKGFTLMEMLIVVAIIAILVAVSIPVFTTQLEKARDATDMANLRAAKGIGVSVYLTGDEDAGTYYYDAVNGVLKDNATGITAYGQGKTDPDNTGKIITVTITDAGTVTAEFPAS